MTATSERMVSRVLVLVFALAIAGCATRAADLTLVSTKNIDLSNTTLDAKTGKRAKGEDCAISLLGLIPLGIPNLETAVDRALDAGGGNVMIDEVTYVRNYYFILFGRSCIDAEGTVLTATTN